MRQTTKFSVLVAIVAALSVFFGGIALADSVQNSVDAVGGVDTRTVVKGGNTTVTYRIVGNNSPNGDAAGCNVDASNPATLTITAPSAVVADDTTLVFTSCGNAGEKSATFSSSTANAGYLISHAMSGGRAGSLWNNDANWTLVVTEPTPTSVAPRVTPVIDDSGATAGNAPWYKAGTVALSWTVTGTPAPSVTGCGSQVISSDGLHSFTCTATNSAGTDLETVTISYDGTAPTITPADVIDTTWRNTSLVQDFTASDTGSGLASAADASFSLTATAGDGTDSRTVADNAGNTTTRTISAFIDDGLPTIADNGMKAGTAGTNGWYTSVVTNEFEASDSLSGFSLGFTNPFTVSSGTAQGGAVVIPSGTVTDLAGNTAASINSAAFMIDLGAPSVAFTSATAGAGNGPSAFGWYKAPVTATFTGTDLVSGFDAAGMDTSTGTDASGANEEAAAVVLDSPAFTDWAGNTRAAGAATHTVKIDMTNPVISGDDVANTTWRNTDLAVSFTAFDALSDLRTASDASFTLTAANESTATTPTTVSKTVTDQAGNTTTRTVSARIDKTAPTVTCDSGQVYKLNQSSPTNVTASVTDNLSGPVNATVGSAPVLTSLGTGQVAVTGYDTAGNATTVECSYTVQAVTTAFSAPVDRAPTVNKTKTGRNIPLKWRLTDANGAPVSTLASAAVRMDGSTACSTMLSTDEVDVYSDTTSGLVNLGNGYYQIDWKTPTTTGCRLVTVTLPGGGGPSAVFQFTK